MLDGRLLVAVPGMLDPNFSATVVYLFDQDDGAAGVIVNRPTDLAVVEAVPRLADAVCPPEVVFLGGPVRTDEAIVVGTRHGTLMLMGDGSDPSEFDRIRVFAGYAGWSPGQLEGEIDDGAWFVVDATPDDVTSPEPEHLWRRIFEREGGALARYQNYPDDPSLN